MGSEAGGTAFLIVVIVWNIASPRDISTNNIITANGRGFLLDYHIARQTGGTGSPLARSGKTPFMALSLHESPRGQHSEATELESLLYCLMDVASGGRALIWRRVEDALVYHVKFTAMKSASEWSRVLALCRVELQAAIQQLHMLVFPEGAVEAGGATADGCLEVLRLAKVELEAEQGSRQGRGRDG